MARRRGRVELRRIEDRVSRQVRFSKRRAGLFKKAFELSLLCDAEVALLVFSPAGKLYEYASASIEDTYNRYQQFSGEGRNMNDDRNKNNLTRVFLVQNKDEASSDLQLMLSEIAAWSPQSKADESDVNELEKLENLLRNALKDTRSRKMQMLEKQNSGASRSGLQSEGATSQEQGTA
ncbi:MADS-box transcription factor 51-like isoform X1 [Miscanthus floridulus]|uniref:MADS-box transcription factor 51-like isoform X1 n=1 Tax=Miscanthus floridulus TaxID=154761 RepID=UPI0034591731